MAVSLHRRRLAALRKKLGALLLERGSVAVRTDTLTMPVQEWRDAAHDAGEEVQRPVLTGLAKQGRVLWAVITDWPKTVEELRRAAEMAALRRARAAAEPEADEREDEGRSSVG